MRFEVLGPVTAERDGEQIPLAAPMVRSLLGVLLLDAGRPVTEARLTEALWGESPPTSVKASLQNHVLRLRRLLGAPDSGRVRRSLDGYLVEVRPGELDLHEFDRLRQRGAESLQAGQWQPAADALSRAVALWRGDPLADALPTARDAVRLDHLREAKLQTFEQLAQARLRLGGYDQVVADLAPLVREHPWREAMHGHLMHALHGAGRQADALAVYQDLRANLVTELGVEPSAGVAELHRRILAADPSLTDPARSTAAATAMSGPGVPNQLPPRTEYFTGRAEVLAALNSHLDDGDATDDDATDRPGARLVAIVGTAGVGKTALAVRWAAEVAHRFPDGCLYADLRGFDPGSGSALAPGQAVRGFLQALGVPSAEIPSEPDERTALFRSLVTGRPLLVVLDNARNAEQVRPLLPGTPGSLTIVTSRDRLAGLVALDGARPIRLDLMTPEEAVALLARRLGAEHAGREPDAVSDLAELCARLPLALNIAAARIATTPHLPLADFAKQLRDVGERLTALDAGDPAASVRAVFSWSYRQLSPAAARVFRLVGGRYPGPDIAVAAAASLTGLPVRQVRTLLAELVGAHLISESVPGRYTYHDLLRAYADEQALAVDEASDRAEATRRMLDHYLHTAVHADRLIMPTRLPITLEEIDPRAVMERFDDAAQAAAWLEQEREALTAATAVAVAHGHDGHAWRLPWALAIFLDRRGDWQVMVELLEQAVHAAGRLGEQHVQARLSCDAAYGRWRVGDPDEALAHLDRARVIWRELDDWAGLSRVERMSAIHCDDSGRFTEALEHSRTALAMARRVGDALGEAQAYTALAWAHLRAREYEAALEHARHGLELHRQVGYHTGQADVLDTMGQACYQLGRHEESLAHFQHAVSVYEADGERFYLAKELVRTSKVHSVMGDAGAADQAMERALKVTQELGLDSEDVIQEALSEMDSRIRSGGVDDGGDQAGGQVVGVAADLEVVAAGGQFGCRAQ